MIADPRNEAAGALLIQQEADGVGVSANRKLLRTNQTKLHRTAP